MREFACLLRAKNIKGPCVLTVLLLLFCQVTCPARCGRHAQQLAQKEVEELLARLRGVPLAGDGFQIGPYQSVTQNTVAKEIVKIGRRAIPTLIGHLPNSDLDSTIIIVHCLTELRAIEAEPQVKCLLKDVTEKKRFLQERDLTLEFQLKRYFEGVREWPKESH